MHRFATASLLLALAFTSAGCGGGSEAVTDPSKLPPLTEDQKKALRQADDQIASEENANPVTPQQARAAKKAKE